MNADQITRAFRNSTAPAARLAAWQSLSIKSRLAKIRAAKRYGGTRESLINNTGPELSSPEAEKPILWISGDTDPEVVSATPGREYLKHQGWYTDDYHEDTVEAYAVRLKRFPGLVFEAMRWSCGGSFSVELSEFWEIDFDECASDYDVDAAVEETEKSAIHAADSSAERVAEREREYQAKDRAEQDLEEKRAEYGEIRETLRPLLAELRELCAGSLPDTFPAAAAAVRRSVKSLLRERRDTQRKIAKLREAIA